MSSASATLASPSTMMVSPTFVVVSSGFGVQSPPAIMITSPVMVQTSTVSMNGSSRATIPSLTGSSVFAAEWAMAADPAPASLLKTALWIPTTITPSRPPRPASKVNAFEMIVPKAAGICDALVPRM